MFRIIALFCFLFQSVGLAKEIALSFDDSPRFARGYLSGPERAKELIKALRTSGVGEVVFYSVSKSLNDEGRARLKAYANAGHIIANHTHSHPNFNTTSLEDYKKEVSLAHKLLSGFSTFRKWFRFPYLREGNTAEKRDGLRAHLESMGYFNAYITSNNYDWYIERLFQRAVKNEPNFSFDRMKKFYVDVLMESIEYYDQMAIRHLGRSPKHVLLLHEMDISALYIDEIVYALREKGWKIISSEEAYQDEIANYKTERVMKYNPGRIAEIAWDRGQKRGLWHETCNEAYLEDRFAREVLLKGVSQ